MHVYVNAALGSLVLLAWMSAAAQERTTNVRQPPDSVFEQPLVQVMPELAGATATGENGRVGGELVFWGYRLADGRPVTFFACAMVADVDCDVRVQAICLDGTTVLKSSTTNGAMIRRQCTNVTVTAPGELRPGCVDENQSATMQVGLVSCG